MTVRPRILFVYFTVSQQTLRVIGHDRYVA
jgi:hypothetical protein